MLSIIFIILKICFPYSLIIVDCIMEDDIFLRDVAVAQF